MFESVDRLGLRGHLDDLLKVRSSSPTLLSAYLVVAPDFGESRTIGPRLRGVLKQAHELADSSGMGHDEKMALQSEIQRLRDLSEPILDHAGRVVAFFESSTSDIHLRFSFRGDGWDVGIAGRRPYIRPLVAALQGQRRVATVIAESRRTIITYDALNGDSRSDYLSGQYPRKRNRGGWYGLDERRNRERADEEKSKLLYETARRVASEHAVRPLDAVYVAGQKQVTSDLLRRLDHPISQMTSELTVDTHTVTEPILRDRVRAAERSAELHRLERLTRLINELRAGGRSSIGLPATIPAANRGAIGTLVIRGRDLVPGWECPECWSLALRAGGCPVCGHLLVSTPDLLDSLTHAVLNAGGDVFHAPSEADLDRALVGAMLRY